MWVESLVFFMCFFFFHFFPKLNVSLNLGFSVIFVSHISMRLHFPCSRLYLSPCSVNLLMQIITRGSRVMGSRGLRQIWDITAIQDPSWDFPQAPGLVLALSAALLLLTLLPLPSLPCNCLWPLVDTIHYQSLNRGRGHTYSLVFLKTPPQGAGWGAGLKPDLISVLPKLPSVQYTHGLCCFERSSFPLVLIPIHCSVCSHVSVSKQAEINICWMDGSMNKLYW